MDKYSLLNHQPGDLRSLLHQPAIEMCSLKRNAMERTRVFFAFTRKVMARFYSLC